jgi:hypothetical protein
MTRTLALAVLVALTTPAVTVPVSAQTPAARSWESLSDADRAALVEPTRERWERATPEQQQRYLDRARFWASLTPEQKRLARAGAERWRQSDENQRGRLREVWRRLQTLPPAEREAARRTWESLGPQQRRAWLDAGGPGVAPPPSSEPPR